MPALTSAQYGQNVPSPTPHRRGALPDRAAGEALDLIARSITEINERNLLIASAFSQLISAV